MKPSFRYWVLLRYSVLSFWLCLKLVALSVYCGYRCYLRMGWDSVLQILDLSSHGEFKLIDNKQKEQIYRWIDIQIYLEIDRQIDIQRDGYTADIQRDRYIDRQRDIQIYSEIDRQIDKQIDRYLARKIFSEIDRQIDIQIFSEIDRQIKSEHISKRETWMDHSFLIRQSFFRCPCQSDLTLQRWRVRSIGLDDVEMEGRSGQSDFTLQKWRVRSIGLDTLEMEVPVDRT